MLGRDKGIILAPSLKGKWLNKKSERNFNAGNHLQTVRLRYKDFKDLVNPRVIPLTEEKKKRAA